MIKNSKLYDRLKFVAQIGLPALGTLYAALALLWGWDNTTQVVGTILAVDTALGTVLGISTAKYNQSEDKFDGTMNIFDQGEKKVFSLDVAGDPFDLQNQNTVILKVNHQQTTKKAAARKKRVPRGS